MALFAAVSAIHELTSKLPPARSNKLGGGEMRPEKIKAGQWGASPKICPVGGAEGGRLGGWKGKWGYEGYQEDMNEAARQITKAMCEKRGAS